MLVALAIAAITIPFEFAADEVFVPVRVNGSAPLWFSVDSGASSTIIHSSRLRELNLSGGEELQGRGAGAGTVAYRKIGDAELRIGSMPGVTYPLIAMDLSGPAQNAGHAMDGILGYEFFARYVVEIDYRRHRMTVTPPDEFREPRRFKSLPLEIYKKVPFVEAELKVPGVASMTSRFLIDTGSADEVDHPLVKQSKGEVHTTVTGVGLGQPTTGYAGRGEYFEIGGYRIRSPAVACCGGNELNQQMIGAGILKRFTVIFDYPHARLYLRPNRR